MPEKEPGDLAADLSVVYWMMDDYIGKVFEDPRMSDRDFYNQALVRRARRILMHAEGTDFLRERLKSEEFYKAKTELDVIVASDLHPFAMTLDEMGIDLKKGQFGPFTQEGAKNLETLTLAGFRAHVEQQYREGGINFKGRQERLLEKRRWTEAYANYYGEPYYLPDNMAGASRNFGEMIELMGLNSGLYHLS